MDIVEKGVQKNCEYKTQKIFSEITRFNSLRDQIIIDQIIAYYEGQTKKGQKSAQINLNPNNSIYDDDEVIISNVDTELSHERVKTRT